PSVISGDLRQVRASRGRRRARLWRAPQELAGHLLGKYARPLRGRTTLAMTKFSLGRCASRSTARATCGRCAEALDVFLPSPCSPIPHASLSSSSSSPVSPPSSSILPSSSAGSGSSSYRGACSPARGCPVFVKAPLFLRKRASASMPWGVPSISTSAISSDTSHSIWRCCSYIGQSCRM
ncbi:hypothetical protein K523DRAFT_152204, partial [Schizophyllum commune Tattone D]